MANTSEAPEKEKKWSELNFGQKTGVVVVSAFGGFFVLLIVFLFVFFTIGIFSKSKSSE